MIIKAGKYTFNEVLTPLNTIDTVEGYINYWTNPSDYGINLKFKNIFHNSTSYLLTCSILNFSTTYEGILVEFRDYLELYMWEDNGSASSPYGSGYSNEGGEITEHYGWYSDDIDYKSIEVLEDTDVDDNQGNWFYSNTKPYEDDTPEEPEEPEQPETPTKKFTRLYIGETVYSSNGKRFKKLQDTEYVEPSEPEETESIIGTWVLNKVYEVNMLETTFYIEGYFNSIKTYNTTPSTFELMKYPLGKITLKGDTTDRVTFITPNTDDDYYPRATLGFSLWNNTNSVHESYNYASSKSDANNDFITYEFGYEIANGTIDEEVYTTLRTFTITGGADVKNETFITWLKANAIKESKGLVFTSMGDGTCYVSGIGTCTDTDIVIPSVSPDGDSVTSIGDDAFYGCSSLTSIEIPDSVTIIGVEAFRECSSLSSVKIPNSVKYLKASAFRCCKSLISIEIPNSQTYFDWYAFEGCSSLKRVVIGDSVSITKGVFLNCTSLENIIFNGTVAQWNEVFKGEDWNTYVPATYVQCTDGQVTL